jgi:hypothetical protein
MLNLRRLIPLLALASTFFVAHALHADFVLDPEADFQEFHAEAAFNPDGNVLLTWTRQVESGGAWSVAAATLDPNSGALGETHEWGAGDAQQVVPLGTGYLAVREDINPSADWAVERLDSSGRRVGTALPIGYARSVVADAAPGGGVIVVAAGGAGVNDITRAWRFGPDGALLVGPTTLVDVALQTAMGVDADGNIVLVWTDQGRRVFAQRFSPDLQPLSGVIPVALGGAFGIRVAVAADGRFVVVYSHEFQLYARAFRANGSAAGARLLCSTRNDSVDEENIGVAISPQGTILVAWKTYVNSNVPILRARYLSLTGRPVSKVLSLAKIADGRGELLRPRAETLDTEDFLVLWTRVDAAGASFALQGRRLSASPGH